MAGSPWPWPQRYTPVNGEFQFVSSGNFTINPTNATNYILAAAIIRYQDRIREIASTNSGLSNLEVAMPNPTEEYPYFGMDESYELTISKGSANLTSRSVWGALRGLETFSQLMYKDDKDDLVIKSSVTIKDGPRFQWRGVMLDTARNYFSINTMKRTLDAMEYNKFNVFHWHIVDNESFPYRPNGQWSDADPQTFDPSYQYTHADVKGVIEYARLRGIRVIPEFDSPGHTRSWKKFQVPGLHIPGDHETIDLTLPRPTKEFLERMYEEIATLFKDDYFHLGGDEVSTDNWRHSNNIAQFMRRHGNDATQLKNYYLQNLQRIVHRGRGTGRAEAVVWQDVYDDGVTAIFPNELNAIIEVWRHDYDQYGWPVDQPVDYEIKVKEITARGLRVILSVPWAICTGEQPEEIDWAQYNVEPCRQIQDANQQNKVVGGEVCLWSENTTDEATLNNRLWPRACLVAERLWSPKADRDPVNRCDTPVDAETPKRLREHIRRMNQRGITSGSMTNFLDDQ